MFARKIARVVLVALTFAVAGCSQVLDMVGLGKPVPSRQPQVSRPLSPIVKATTDFNPPVFYSPAPAPTAGWAYTPPAPTPVGPILLWAEVRDLGQGLREIVPDFKHCKGCLKDPIYYDLAILMDCAVDDTGRVYLVVHSVRDSIGMYWTADMTSVFRLDELTVEAATFSRVATSSGGISNEVLYQDGTGRIRHGIFKEFEALLPSPAATAPLDIVYSPVYDSQAGRYNAFLLRNADNTTVVLSADGEEKWGQRELTLDGLPDNSWDVWWGLPWVKPFQRQTFSVGYNSAVNLHYDSGGVSKTLVRVKGRQGSWRDLTGTGVPPVYQNLAPGVGVDWQQNWVYYSTEFSPRWRAHFMWVGRYWGRVLLYLDNP